MFIFKFLFKFSNLKDLSLILVEIQKKQGNIETILRQHSLGQKVRNLPRGFYQQVENRLFNIVSNYEQYIEKGNVLKYLKNIGYHLHL